ncbi:Eco57I restriction-modification methylase domain-containing protein [Chryseobacterium shandongense]|uniref:Eco57I restriction-modification methylase domain-containing protein n=1 Tax=Chryseobacterium shandongense TaxID=1493872 RepID=UPI000F4FEFE8|nr:N-6 DNA methylase [Chryseobacterium shandongense]AZA56286.1 adenine methyltransferase [Chryseobacterium shandongense]
MEIRDLINRFETEKSRFTTTTYNETQLRTDFLDPLFSILGWDINNTQGKPKNEREVLVEEGLRADANENTKKPDYTFRLFSERKFFVEAKKPSVKIESDSVPAKQVRRYGFTAKLKISVLTNFEYLAIYDCSEVVDTNDTVSKRRLKLYHFSEFEEKLDEIKSLIGKDSVYSGQFDEVWEDIELQIQKFNIDDLFLKQINEWRILLGNEIYSTNPAIDEFQLNDIVQSYINSIVFLRVCEDRNLEVYKTLCNLAENESFTALIEKFRLADTKYNAGLFSQPLSEEIISYESCAFWTIIKQLYFPESTYSFIVFSSEILGHIYEIFLGEQLTLENGIISLKKKPEIEDRDIVTTPTFIVRDILNETVKKYCENKTAEEILNSKFADIACGSGAFLLETFQFLQDILVDFYVHNDSTKVIQNGINNYKLKYEVKKQILLQCIFGVDKDFNAVEACKFGLLLKLLEDEDNASISVPALPNLDNTIQFGNSLIDSSQTNQDNRDVINPFDFGELRFDVIVGNPPYLATEHIKKFTPEELPIYKNIYSSAFMQFDKYFIFTQRGYDLLKPNGILGFIIPSKFAKVGAGKNLRKLLSEETAVKKIVSFGANQIFKDKTTYTCVLILDKSAKNFLQYHEVENIGNWKSKNYPIEYDNVEFSGLNDDTWVLMPNHLKPIFERISEQSIDLVNLIGNESIFNGIQTSANPIYIHTSTRIDNEYIYFTYEGREWKVEKELTRPYFKTSRGIDNLNTYRLLEPNSFVIYPYKNINGQIRFVEIETMQRTYPETFRFLENYKEELEDRDIKPLPETQNEWYRFGRHQSLDKCDVSEKIIVGVLSQGNKYAIDIKQTLFSSGGTAGYCLITLPENLAYSVYYIQALLNSKYSEWFASLYGEVFRGGFIARGTKVLKKLPIRKIDFQNEAERVLHNNISNIQQELIHLQGNIDANLNNSRQLVPLQRRFALNKVKLDNLLEQLYNLGDSDSLIPKINEKYATN